MKGISSSEFYDKLYYGADIDLCYHSVFYHICAGYEDGSLHSITVYEYDKNPDTKPSYYKEIYSKSNFDVAKNIGAFLNSEIFCKRRLKDIESEIEVIYS